MRLLERVSLTNLLSFRKTTVELQALNVLVGENTSGKSNLIEAIGLLRALPSNELQANILNGGGIRSWLNMGSASASPIASISCDLLDTCSYAISIGEQNRAFLITDEALTRGRDERLLFRTGNNVEVQGGPMVSLSLAPESSGLSAFNHLTDNPIANVARGFGSIRIFRDFQTGQRAGSRTGISTTTTGNFLMESGDNLALVLQKLAFRDIDAGVADYLGKFSDRLKGVRVDIESGIAMVYVVEKDLRDPVPSLRMSDGTLRFLCLLAILLHPDPPPLVCLEEPEKGLHPDAIRLLGRLLLAASERMQLIVTTHSPALIDALSDTPESVLVCERDPDNGTQFRRLAATELEGWLETYSLGELWTKGEIGGNRW